MKTLLVFLLSSACIIGPAQVVRATDCNSNDTLDTIDLGALYVGTRAAGTGSAEVWRYDGTDWVNLTPSWTVATVMDLAVYDHHLYAATQKLHGYAGGATVANGGLGQVWRYENVGTSWTLVTTYPLDASVMVLETMGAYLYAGTANGVNGSSSQGSLYRYDGTTWTAYVGGTTPWNSDLGSSLKYYHGFRAGTVSTICGENQWGHSTFIGSEVES